MQTTDLCCARQGRKKLHPFPTPSDILLCKQLRARGALTFENRHKLLGGKLNQQLACLGQNSKWKAPQDACSKPEREILLSLREFLPRVPDLRRPHFSFAPLSVQSFWEHRGCRHTGLEMRSQVGEVWSLTAFQGWTERAQTESGGQTLGTARNLGDLLC